MKQSVKSFNFIPVNKHTYIPLILNNIILTLWFVKQLYNTFIVFHILRSIMYIPQHISLVSYLLNPSLKTGIKFVYTTYEFGFISMVNVCSRSIKFLDIFFFLHKHRLIFHRYKFKYYTV